MQRRSCLKTQLAGLHIIKYAPQEWCWRQHVCGYVWMLYPLFRNWCYCMSWVHRPAFQNLLPKSIQYWKQTHFWRHSGSKHIDVVNTGLRLYIYALHDGDPPPPAYRVLLYFKPAHCVQPYFGFVYYVLFSNKINILHKENKHFCSSRA